MELRAQEQRLVEIRRRATLLAVALVSEPFSIATDERLRAYADEDADDAQVLAQELRELLEEVLRARIAELTSKSSNGLAVVGNVQATDSGAGAERMWPRVVRGESADIGVGDLRGWGAAE